MDMTEPWEQGLMTPRKEEQGGKVGGHDKDRERAEQDKLEGRVGTRQVVGITGKRRIVDGLAEGRGQNMTADMRRGSR